MKVYSSSNSNRIEEKRKKRIDLFGYLVIVMVVVIKEGNG